MIIDDDKDIIDAIKVILEPKGYKIDFAMNPDEGMKLIENEKPDLIFLDVMMNEPDDGFFMALKLRKQGIQTPIVMLTSVSKATGLDFGMGENLPVQEFLEKPAKSDVIEEVVKKYLE